MVEIIRFLGNPAIGNFIVFVTAVILLGTGWAIYNQFQVAKDQFDIAARSQFNDQLGRGAELLAHPELTARVSGVRVLEDLAKSVDADSDKNKLISDILLDFVRARAAPPVQGEDGTPFEATELRKVEGKIEGMAIEANIFSSVLENWPESKPRAERLDIERAIFALTKIVPKTAEGYYSIQINLSGLDLRGLNLNRVNLRGANLGGSNLEGALLGDANLQGANLWGANLQGANLQNANLDDADLTGVRLQGAELTHAVFSKSNLLEAELDWADATNAEMMEVRWLTTKQTAQVIYYASAPPKNLPDNIKLSPDRAYHNAGEVVQRSRILSDIDRAIEAGRPLETFMDQGDIEYFSSFPRYSAETIKHAQKTAQEHSSLRYIRYFVPSDKPWSEQNVHEWVAKEIAKEAAQEAAEGKTKDPK